MKKLIDFIAERVLNALQNRHTSGSAAIYGGLAVAQIIWPQYAIKFKQLQEAAVVYGLVNAGDGRPKANGVPAAVTDNQNKQ